MAALPVPAFVRREWLLGLSAITVVGFFVGGEALFDELVHPIWLILTYLWLFLVVLGSALAVARHADHLALRLGEPYGTLILTLSVTSVEVMSISAVMLHGGSNPTLVRDTLLSVVMIMLNGMVGASLLIGAWRHHEQQYNLQGANAYLTVIIPLAVLGLILPNFTLTTSGPTLSIAQESVLAFMSVGLYAVFLAIQTVRHRSYFVLEDESEADHADSAGPIATHAGLLAIYMLLVVFLAEDLARPVDYFVETLGAPDTLGGLTIAILVAAPEAIGAIRAAIANNLQRSVNIFLGSVLSTIGLTVPIMLAISELTGRHIILGVQNSDFVMLLLTLTVSVVTFASGRTNVLQGAVHLLLFAAYLLLMVEG